MSRYERGYGYENYNRHARCMVEDVAATKEAAYQELEKMAHEMLKFIDENSIGTFKFEITSYQRGKSWTIEASEKDICGKFKWDNSPSKEGKDE